MPVSVSIIKMSRSCLKPSTLPRAAAWGGASSHTYTFTRRRDGLTDIDLVTVRDGKNLKGWLLGLVVGTIGKSVLEKAFVNSVKAIEARNGAAREVGAA